MSDQHPVNLSSSGLPSTVLPAEPDAVTARLADACGLVDGERLDAVRAAVADHPRSLFGWATLGDVAAHPIDRYAAYRIGYHRGLDALRANGWRGSGYVRWSEPTNRGFLRALQGLAAMAATIGEDDEAERCRQFLAQLDPGGPHE